MILFPSHVWIRIDRRVEFDRFIDGKTSRLNAGYDMLLSVSRGLPKRARPGCDVRISKTTRSNIDVVINLV